MISGNNIKKSFLFLSLLLTALFLLTSVFSGCSINDMKNKLGYLVKTEPEKTVIDFLNALSTKRPETIYDDFLKTEDKNNISREKFINELNVILNDIEDIDIGNTVYLGYEKEFAKVVCEFNVSYVNGEMKEYKKYIYLLEENKSWKIVFDKTFF
ncbi:MAG: NTF2-like N-terminal transpeptidase domain-containing protein [Actinomycetota bacterium]|nr:NTF2-like N-terminal transpeptidase domain-containing protein [Actinomycetota bacterium]